MKINLKNLTTAASSMSKLSPKVLFKYHFRFCFAQQRGSIWATQPTFNILTCALSVAMFVSFLHHPFLMSAHPFLILHPSYVITCTHMFLVVCLGPILLLCWCTLMFTGPTYMLFWIWFSLLVTPLNLVHAILTLYSWHTNVYACTLYASCTIFHLFFLIKSHLFYEHFFFRNKKYLKIIKITKIKKKS